MTDLEIRKAARELISDPARWCREVAARNAHGLHVPPYAGNGACQWCALGAAAHVAPEYGDEGDAVLRLRDAAREIGFDGAISANDIGGHEAVLRMFDLAIAELEPTP